MDKSQSEQKVQELLNSKGSNQSEIEEYIEKQNDLKKQQETLEKAAKAEKSYLEMKISTLESVAKTHEAEAQELKNEKKKNKSLEIKISELTL